MHLSCLLLASIVLVASISAFEERGETGGDYEKRLWWLLGKRGGQPNQDEALVKIFIQLDADGDGFVDLNELRNGPKELFAGGRTPEDILHEADTNADGKVDIDEFHADARVGSGPSKRLWWLLGKRSDNGPSKRLWWLLGKRGGTQNQDEILVKMFIQLDTDGDGFVDIDELRNGPKEMFAGGRTPEDMMHEADTNGDGKVDIDEFHVDARVGNGPSKRLWWLLGKRTGNGPSKRLWWLLGKRDHGTANQDEMLVKMFIQLDADGDGFVDLGELKNGPTEMFAGGRTPEDMLEEADTNGDGKVDIDEFHADARVGKGPSKRLWWLLG